MFASRCSIAESLANIPFPALQDCMVADMGSQAPTDCIHGFKSGIEAYFSRMRGVGRESYCRTRVRPGGLERVKVGIVGSREFPKMAWVHRYVRERMEDGDVLVSGGARGVDQQAEYAARERGLECLIFPADWEGEGKRAGMMRNAEIVANSERLVAFWDGVSTGTAHTIRLAKEKGLAVWVCDGSGRVTEWIGQEKVLRRAALHALIKDIFSQPAEAFLQG
jgi:predicted Rossmann fold nucleotide-binding protein DprA/Smf involved in DNA uptake